MVVDIPNEASGEAKTNGKAVGDDAMEENEDETILTDEHHANKRVKMGGVNGKQTSKCKDKVKPTEPVCEICLQRLNDQDLRLYAGHPNNAADEYSVLLDPRLCLFNGDEVDITESDARALNKITSFR